MLYLLDANCFIHANNTYYALDRVPEYWEWLLFKAAANVIKTPRAIFDEIVVGKDPLAVWVKDHEAELVLGESPAAANIQHVLDNGYAPNLTQEELEKLGRDPILISHGLGNPQRTIVSKEISKPSKVGANRKVPDVCASLGVLIIDDFHLIRTLDFTTAWKDKP